MTLGYFRTLTGFETLSGLKPAILHTAKCMGLSLDYAANIATIGIFKKTTALQYFLLIEWKQELP